MSMFERRIRKIVNHLLTLGVVPCALAGEIAAKPMQTPSQALPSAANGQQMAAPNTQLSLQEMLAQLSREQQLLAQEARQAQQLAMQPPAVQMASQQAIEPPSAQPPLPQGQMLAQAAPKALPINQIQAQPAQPSISPQPLPSPVASQPAQPQLPPQQLLAQASPQQVPEVITGQQMPQSTALPQENMVRQAGVPQSAPIQSAIPIGTKDMTAAQFQQWLQNNGYTKNPAQTTTVVTNTGTTPTVTGTTPTAISNFQAFQKAPRHEASNRQAPLKPKPLNYEQGQRAILESVPKGNVPSIPDADIAFNMMLQQNMPLTPQQVVQLRQQIDVAQRAAATPPNIPPKPVSSTVMVNLAPGTTPPAIRLAQGYVSSLVFVDSTSQPWPIAAFDIGNPKAVNIQWDGKSNILLLQAISAYSDGDIVIRLVGNPTPITLELVSGQRVVDYRVDLHVPGIGPNSKDIPMGTALPGNPNQLLLGVLDGVSPAGSKTLNVHGADAQAWLLGEKMYLRTRLTLLSPGWVATMVSPDGMHAYELPKTSSVLVSRYGEPALLKIEGF